MKSTPAPVVEHFFRHEAGRLTATLVRILGPHQFDVAEEVVQDTLLAALERWKFSGMPDNPAAWLNRTARNRALDVLRRRGTRRKVEPELIAALTVPGEDPSAHFGAEVADDALRLMFSACEPALPPAAQVALILKCLCGFSVPEIAAALLSTPSAVERRLSRAKAVVRSAGLVEVSGVELRPRLSAVQRAIYLLFNEGFHGSHSEQVIREDLCGEAIRLGALLASHPATDDASNDALMALMCLHAARLGARTGAEGELVTLRHQDRRRWNPALVALGVEHLSRSARGPALTSLHLEAGLASVHAMAASWDATDWGRIVEMYDALVQLAPGPVVALNRAIAVGWRDGPEAGLAAIDRIDTSKLGDYPFLPAARAEFLARAGRGPEADRQFGLAIAAARNPDEAAFFAARRAEEADRSTQRDQALVSHEKLPP